MLTVAVFSYNRGDYLRNCVQSVQRNIPHAVIKVYDDNSDDPATLTVLAELGVPVITTDVNDIGRHGGLYANMQTALMAAKTQWILFLQEDMQVVRRVDDSDLNTIAALFAEDPQRAFISPVFIKGVRLKRHQRLNAPQSDPRCYRSRCQVTDTEYAARITYNDVCIGNVARLRQAEWNYVESEHGNVLQARRLFSDMPTLGAPFVFFLPEVPVFRDRRKSLAARIAARMTRQGIKSFHDMTPDEAARFVARSLDQWPVAENYLRSIDPTVRRPFVYKDVNRHWWLALLHRLETWFR